MLIRAPQQSARDIEAWERDARSDPIVARSAAHALKTERSAQALQVFADEGPCYVGVSWGKDSVCVAHLSLTLPIRLPIVWIRVEPITNPHCVLVRDAFLARFDVDYHEIKEAGSITRGRSDLTSAFRTSASGFANARERFGDRHVSGVRAEESRERKMRMSKLGTSSAKTCAPIGWWSAADVFAYLHAHNLPIHPAYAMTFGGMLSRERVRVGSLGGKRGDGMGRAEWEMRYYGWRLREIERECRQDCESR